jgi:hypothetical protein
MRSVRRNLTDGLAISAMAISFALAWGSPFVGASARAQDQAQPPQQQPAQPQPDQAQPQPQPEQPAQPQPDQSKSSTFTGTIVRSGRQYALRDSSGQIFKLDDPDRAKPYEGKTVKVTGQLDEQAMVIHVESIEGAEA